MENVSANKFDEDGREIFVGDTLEAWLFNGEEYKATLKVVVDDRDGDVCLQMMSGNEKAMMRMQGREYPYQAFGSERNGRLIKGRIINR